MKNKIKKDLIGHTFLGNWGKREKGVVGVGARIGGTFSLLTCLGLWWDIFFCSVLIFLFCNDVFFLCFFLFLFCAFILLVLAWDEISSLFCVDIFFVCVFIFSVCVFIFLFVGISSLFVLLFSCSVLISSLFVVFSSYFSLHVLRQLSLSVSIFSLFEWRD